MSYPKPYRKMNKPLATFALIGAATMAVNFATVSSAYAGKAVKKVDTRVLKNESCGKPPACQESKHLILRKSKVNTRTGSGSPTPKGRWPRWRNGCKRGGWGSVKCPKW